MHLLHNRNCSVARFHCAFCIHRDGAIIVRLEINLIVKYGLKIDQNDMKEGGLTDLREVNCCHSLHTLDG